MDIEVVWGRGDGATPLGAYDTALAAAGMHNYNLVELSSVVPTGSTVRRTGSHERCWPVGEFVGVVLAGRRSATQGERLVAGLGWALASEGGVFYEATGSSPAAVEASLADGLETALGRRDWSWTTSGTEVLEHTVGASDAGAVVVAAVYRPV